MQFALAAYMENEDAYLRLPAFYQAKRDRLLKGLAHTKFAPMHSEGTFFLMADYSKISSLPEAEFAHWLTIEHGIGVIPVSAFYRQPDAAASNHNLIRFCFAKRDETLDKAIEKLAGI